MESQIKNKVISLRSSFIIGIFLLIIIAILSVKQCSQININDDMKHELIQRDSLKKVSDGVYNKIVDDLKSQKQLNAILSDNNSDLAERLKLEKQKLVSYINIKSTFEPKEQDQQISQHSVVSLWDEFIDYYPDQNNPFVTYSMNKVNDSIIKTKWSFSDLTLDLTISEGPKGIFNANFEGPKFMKVKVLEVNSLPLEPIIQDNFDWLVGGGSLYNPTDQSIKFQLMGGIRYKKSNFLLQSTGNYHGIMFVKGL